MISNENVAITAGLHLGRVGIRPPCLTHSLGFLLLETQRMKGLLSHLHNCSPKTFFQFVSPPLWIFLNEGLNSANVSFLNQYLISQTIVLVT